MCIAWDQLYQFWSSCLLHVQIKNIVEILQPILFGIIIGPILWKQFFFPIILKRVVGSDSQSLSPLRPSWQNLRVHYEIIPLKVKF